jgi:UDP-glucose 4-epimerase
MNVLLTGAFGNVGTSTLTALLDQGHTVRCFDVKTRANVRASRRFKQRAEVMWGDLRRPADLEAAVRDQEAVIHLAFIIPKLSVTGFESEDHPDWAYDVNVGGTRNLIEATKALPKPPRILFSSSYHIYGRTQHQDPPRTVSDPLQPIEHYTYHKIECEEMIRDSGLEWSIFRLAATLPLGMKLDPGMFDIPLANRMEYVHTRDVGLALANALSEPRTWDKVLLIGGGPRCQYTYRQITQQVLEGMGVGMLPDEAFGHTPFPTDWLDTQESQEILQYQHHTLADYVQDVRAKLRARILLIRALRPLVRALLLSQSPHLRGDQPTWLSVLIYKVKTLKHPPEIEAQ